MRKMVVESGQAGESGDESGYAELASSFLIVFSRNEEFTLFKDPEGF